MGEEEDDEEEEEEEKEEEEEEEQEEEEEEEGEEKEEKEEEGRRKKKEGRRKSEVKCVQEERRDPGPKQGRFVLQRREPCDVVSRGLSACCVCLWKGCTQTP